MALKFYNKCTGFGVCLICSGISLKLYNVWICTAPKWSRPQNDFQPLNDPNLTPKWYRLRNDPHFSSRRPRNDPQLILGMEWYSVTELLQVCCSVYVLESHLTFHYSLCDFLALLSSNRLYVYFCIFSNIYKFLKVLKHHF